MTGLFVTDEKSVTDFLCDQRLDACSTDFSFVHTGSTFAQELFLFPLF